MCIKKKLKSIISNYKIQPFVLKIIVTNSHEIALYLALKTLN